MLKENSKNCTETKKQVNFYLIKIPELSAY